MYTKTGDYLEENFQRETVFVKCVCMCDMYICMFNLKTNTKIQQTNKKARIRKRKQKYM